MKFPRKFFKKVLRNTLQKHKLDVEVRCLSRFRDKDSNWPKHIWCRSLKELEESWPKIENINRRGYDIHFTVVPRERKWQGKKEHPLPAIPVVVCLWADLDVGEDKPFKTLEDALRKVASTKPKPSIVVVSGSGIHVYYLLRRPVRVRRERVEALLQALASRLNGDTGAARATRLMRMPNTYNWKGGPRGRKLCKAIYYTSAVYRLKGLESYWKPARETVENRRMESPRGQNGKYSEFFKKYIRGFVSSQGSVEATGLCPFHTDKEPSFSVNLETGLWKCFSERCKAKGNLQQFCKSTSVPVPNIGRPQRFPRLIKLSMDEKWPGRKLFAEIYTYITSQVHFTQSWQPVVVAVWAMGTYLYRQFPCYGHLWLNSPTTHSGKSKLLNVLWTLCDQALAPQVEPTAAALFRFPQAIGGTLLLDEIDNLNPEKRSDVISVLNQYLSSGVVVRAVSGKNKKFVLEKLPVYCPKVIAGIENLPPTLQDRCIKVSLHRKKESEKVERFMPDTYTKLEPVRDQLELWAVCEGLKIVAAYRQVAKLQVPKNVDDRAKDILEPLFAIASVLPEEVTGKLVEAANVIAKDRAKEEEETNTVVQGIQVLKEQFPKGKEVWFLRTDKAFDLFSEEMSQIDTKESARALLRRLGFHSKRHRAGEKVLRGYEIPRRKLERMCERYGLAQLVA